jgi:acetate kinase
MNVLVLNCGSSTVKFQVIATDQDRIDRDADQRLARGIVERVGGQALITLQSGDGPLERHAEPLRDHRAAIDRVLRWLVAGSTHVEGVASLADIHAVGHRVVHGGERFRASVRIDQAVLDEIAECIELAPLHNPANLKGIGAAVTLLGEGVPQIAVFDTSFHATMPATSYLYGVPYQLYRRHRIRRYGFHGTSHRYIAYRYRRLLDIHKEQVRIITLHLGNGCSACAIKEGVSFNTSMGFTPLEGLVMGTRSGDIDPSLVEYLAVKDGLTLSGWMPCLNKQSGLLGISGLTWRHAGPAGRTAENDDRRPSWPSRCSASGCSHYIGAYLAELGGGCGRVQRRYRRERARGPRADLPGLEALGIELDPVANRHTVAEAEGAISTPSSRIKVFVIPKREPAHCPGFVPRGPGGWWRAGGRAAREPGPARRAGLLRGRRSAGRAGGALFHQGQLGRELEADQVVDRILHLREAGSRHRVELLGELVAVLLDDLRLLLVSGRRSRQLLACRASSRRSSRRLLVLAMRPSHGPHLARTRRTGQNWRLRQ